MSRQRSNPIFGRRFPLIENGTIYGQVFPLKTTSDGRDVAEIHYYHLWARDCGGHGHRFGYRACFRAGWRIGHASFVIQMDGNLLVCRRTREYSLRCQPDRSCIDSSRRGSRCESLDFSRKHASYLSPTVCQRGCGADRCEEMIELTRGSVINLGEPDHPMNGSLFISSKAWPLAGKMSATNFPQVSLTRLNSFLTQRSPGLTLAAPRAGDHCYQQFY